MKKVIVSLSILASFSLGAETLIKVEDSRISVNSRYSTPENITKNVMRGENEIWVRPEVSEALIKVAQEIEEKSEGVFKLEIWDGYQSKEEQQKIWNQIQDDTVVVNPANESDAHCRGVAVDVTLVDNEGNVVIMPSDFDQPCVKKSAEAEKNYQFLKEVMERNGFTPDEETWYHFTYGNWEQYSVIPE